MFFKKWCAESIVGENKLKAKFEPYGTKGTHCKAMGIYKLCGYRTENYDEFKKLTKKIGVFEEKEYI